MNLRRLLIPTLLYCGLILVGYYEAGVLHALRSVWHNIDPKIFHQLLQTSQWLAGAWLLTHFLNDLILSPLIHRRTGKDPARIIFNIITAVIFLITIFIIIHRVFAQPIAGLIATSGVVTLIIGFAIRDMIADFFSGLAMNMEQPYQLGDWLELEGGATGQVSEINWRATRLLTLERKMMVIPNNNLANRQFINLSKPERHYRESLNVVLNYTTDVHRAETILQAAVLATEGLSKAGQHQVRIKEFSDRGVVYELRFWVPDHADAVKLRHSVAANVLTYLNQAGISIPYAQAEITVNRPRKPRKEDRIDTRRLLSRVQWLSTLTEDELNHLGSVTTGHEYLAGDAVVTQGEMGSSLYVLVEGVAEARSVADGNGQGESVGRIVPGQAFGEMALLTGSPRIATVRAVTDIYVLEVRREDLEPILRARPAIAQELGRMMAARAMENERLSHFSDPTVTHPDLRARAVQFARRISRVFGIAH